ncbi:hypothetical protein NDU88_003916 [Pleurodeles waltl]|uniref:Uncharacterized protein n=1 Tax=Pleurodeles waltl TaxID=8319 RepID=A0AAV7KWB8_PLEWA|nr:hypothetical protein NDU88_003916 [Pleurodeles waltl]
MQGYGLDRYTVCIEALESQTQGAGGGPWGEVPGPEGEPLLSTIMAAIQDIRSSISPLEPKFGVVQIDVILLRIDLGKISEKVAVAETHIGRLMATTKRLEEQAWSLTKKELRDGSQTGGSGREVQEKQCASGGGTAGHRRP